MRVQVLQYGRPYFRIQFILFQNPASMKFAFVIFKYFPFGGAQRDMMRIARECVKRGHEVHVYALSWQGPAPENGIHVHVVKGQGWTNHRRYQDFIHRVQAEITAEHFELVVGFNRMPGLDVYFAADPCFIERVGPKWKLLQRLSGRYRFFAESEHAVFSPASNCEILLLSPREKSIFQHWYGTPDMRFHLMPPYIAMDRYAGIDVKEARGSVRAEFGLRHDDRLLLMVGSGFRTKGLDRAIEGVAALPPDFKSRTRLLAVGQDNAQPFLALAKRLGLHDQVIISGGRDDIPRLMHAADLLVHPARSELAGHVLIEAMAAGLPVLVSDICGYAFHVAQANAGELVSSPFDQKQFNLQLQQILISDRFEALGTNGREYAQALMGANDGSAEARVIEATAQPKIGKA
jgi:UDP-glucose:(heptosyl)LPS alpha-1,3-glucosyltransferase